MIAVDQLLLILDVAPGFKLGDHCFEQRPDCVGSLRGPSL
jgi:hypothetical protein